MKLRLDKNSIRLRLRISDLEKLREKHSVSETILFPNGHFSFDLSMRNDVDEVSAAILDHSLQVALPAAIAREWIENDEVGIYHSARFISDHSLEIIIEKDFPCKDKSPEENSDTFVELAEKKQSDQC